MASLWWFLFPSSSCDESELQPCHRAGLCSCWRWLELEEALLFTLMCFIRAISGITFCKGLVCSALLEHPALSAQLRWGPRYFWAGVLVPLQLSAAIVLSVLLCESCVLTPQDTETSVVTVWWKGAMTGSSVYLRFVQVFIWVTRRVCSETGLNVIHETVLCCSWIYLHKRPG